MDFYLLKPSSTFHVGASLSSVKRSSGFLQWEVTLTSVGYRQQNLGRTFLVLKSAGIAFSRGLVDFSQHQGPVCVNSVWHQSQLSIFQVPVRHPLTLFKRLGIYCHCFHLEGFSSRRVAVWAFISILVTISLVTITMATVSEARSFCILKCWAAAEWKEGEKTQLDINSAWLLLLDSRIRLAWRMKKLHTVSRKRLDRVLTFEQMAACCQRNWVLRGNFQSGIVRKIFLHWQC